MVMWLSSNWMGQAHPPFTMQRWGVETQGYGARAGQDLGLDAGKVGGGWRVEGGWGWRRAEGGGGWGLEGVGGWRRDGGEVGGRGTGG